MKSTTRYISDYVYEGTNENGNVVRVDMSPNDEKAGQSPVELLLSALASCVAVEIALIIKKKRKNLVDLVIETNAVRRDTNPKGLTDVHHKYILTSPDVTSEELQKIIQITIDGYCSVADSLKANLTFETEVKTA
jgi:putative redox protein